jgi:hypothetical protein
MDANTLSGNAGGGVALSGSEFNLTNNFIVLNGGVSSAYGGVQVLQPGAMATLSFNTIADNTASGTTASGVRCIDAAVVSSSIVHGNDNDDLSPACAPSHCHLTADGDPGFVGGGDYHLAPGATCIDGADPAATLSHDVDGQPRPQGVGPDIGADEAG